MSNLPPGVTAGMINRMAEDGPCAVCARAVDHCICPECNVCGTHGDPRCYEEVPKHGVMGAANGCPHGMLLTRDQMASRRTARIETLMDQIQELSRERTVLQDTQHYSDEIVFSSESPFSRRLSDNPDPWS